MVILSNRRGQCRQSPNCFAASFLQTAFDVLMERIFVVVILVFGAITSRAQTPPVIIGYPQNQQVTIGSNAVFSVAATGDNPVYQWYFNDTAIVGAMVPTLILTNVQTTQAGNYSVSV